MVTYLTTFIVILTSTMFLIGSPWLGLLGVASLIALHFEENTKNY